MPSSFLSVDTNFPKQTGDVKQDTKTILNYLYMLMENLRYMLYNLSPNNFNSNELSNFVDEIRAGVVAAETVISNTVITEVLYAQYGTIAELTVDSLQSGNKIINYLNSDTSDINFIDIHDQTISFITGETEGLTEQLVDKNGIPLYWKGAVTAETYKTVGMSTEITAYPVIVYDYDETIKQTMSFEMDSESGYYVPKLIMGAGSGVGDNGKAKIYKDGSGFYIDYFGSVTGEKWTIRITDEGIDFSGFPSITYEENVVIQGMTQVWVQTDMPTAAKEKDIWVDTDDYTRYDNTHLTASTVLGTNANEFITAAGAITITLHAATAAGIIKKIYNTGTDIVTIAGTINGITDMYLYPGESAELITDGSEWRY